MINMRANSDDVIKVPGKMPSFAGISIGSDDSGDSIKKFLSVKTASMITVAMKMRASSPMTMSA